MLTPETYKHFLAKSTPQLTLFQHTENLKAVSAELILAHKATLAKYANKHNLTLPDLEGLLCTVIVYHDLGKSDPVWQAAIKAVIVGKTGRLVVNGFRHEFQSVHEAIDKLLHPLQGVAILAHHGKLRRNGSAWDHRTEFKDLYDQIVKLHQSYEGVLPIPINKEGEFSFLNPKLELWIKEKLNLKTEFAVPRLFLQICDQEASARESGGGFWKWKPFSYSPFLSLRPVQKLIITKLDDPVTLLRAPTGSGKTAAALMWADHQIKSGRADRLIFAMPTKFTSNALAVSSSLNSLSKGLFHSTSFATNQDQSDNSLASYFEFPCVITTIDQLLAALAGVSEKSQKAFANLTSACVVIDESDFYDEFTRRSIDVLITALKVIDVRVLVMSATLPDNVTKIYYSFKDLKILSEDSQGELPKYKFLEPLNLSKPLETIQLGSIVQAAKSKPVILYANTVAAAKEYYRILRDLLPELAKDRILLHHSRFTEPDKKNKEAKILELAGEDAWKGKNVKPFIIILTQIGELSLNISCKAMFSEICPLDRLLQRLGRLERFSEAVGEITIIHPYKQDAPYYLPYTTCLEKHYPLSHTKKLLDGLISSTQSKQSLFEIVNNVYGDEYLEWLNSSQGVSAVINERNFYEAIKSNIFLLPELPLEDANQDDVQVNNWKSRDIQPEVNIWVGNPKGAYKNRSEYRRDEIVNTLSIPVYEYNSLVQSGKVCTNFEVCIQDEVKGIRTLNKKFYTKEYGIDL